MSTRRPPTALPTRTPTPKVVAGGSGAGAGGVLALFVIGMLDDHVYDPTVAGDVPIYVQAVVFLLVPALASLVLGYVTPRGLEEVAPVVRRGEHMADS